MIELLYIILETEAVSLPVGQFDEHIDSFKNQHSPDLAIITYSCGDSDIL